MVPRRLSKEAQKFTKLFRERERVNVCEYVSVCGVKPLNVSILHEVSVNVCCAVAVAAIQLVLLFSALFLYRFA